MCFTTLAGGWLRGKHVASAKPIRVNIWTPAEATGK